MNICEWMDAHPKGIKFKCDCGSTVYIQIWVEDRMIGMSARCWNCNKEMEFHESRFLVDKANFDIVDHLIENFKKEFNKKEKQIRVVK